MILIYKMLEIIVKFFVYGKIEPNGFFDIV